MTDLPSGNGDLVAGDGHLPSGPAGAIRPARRLGLRRIHDGGDADEGDDWNKQREKERTNLSSHGFNPRIFCRIAQLSAIGIR